MCVYIHAGLRTEGPDLLLYKQIFRLREADLGKQILWGWKGDFGNAEAKGPINSCGHLEASEGVLPM